MFPKSLVAEVVEHIRLYHDLIFCQYVIDETCKTFLKKRPEKYTALLTAMYILPHSIFDFDLDDISKYPPNRDYKDIPVLANAIEAGVDILVTGDTDFDNVNIIKPRIMKPRQYRDELMK